jgi:hypothetical protein
MAMKTSEILADGFGVVDIEEIGVKVNVFRGKDPDDDTQQVVGVHVKYAGESGYIFPWKPEYEESTASAQEEVRLDIIKILRDLLATIENNDGAPLNVH